MPPRPFDLLKAPEIPPEFLRRVGALYGQTVEQIDRDIGLAEARDAGNTAAAARAEITAPTPLRWHGPIVQAKQLAVRAEQQPDGDVIYGFDATVELGQDHVAMSARGVWVNSRPNLLRLICTSTNGAPTLNKLGELAAGSVVTEAVNTVNTALTAAGAQPLNLGDPAADSVELFLVDDEVRQTRASFRVDPAVQWKITSDVLLTNLVLGFGRTWQTGQPTGTALSIACSLILHQRTHLLLSLGLPDVSFSGRLDPDAGDVKLCDFLSDLGLGEDFWPSTLSLHRLGLLYEPAAAHHKRFDLDLVGDWELVSGIRLEEFGATIDLDENHKELSLTSTLRFLAGDAAEVQVALSARYDSTPDSSTLIFEGTVAPAHPLALGELIDDVLAKTELGLRLPDFLDALVVTNLDVSLEIDRTTDGDRKLTSKQLAIGFGVASSHGRWELIPGLLEFGPAEIGITVVEGAVQADIRELVNVLGVDWAVEVQLPSLTGSAQMASGGYRIGGIAEHFGLHSLGGFSDLKLKAASIAFDARSRFAQVHVELADAWEMDHFQVDDVQFDVSYRGGEGGGATADLRAVMEIGNAQMPVRAAHPGPGQGWNFDGMLTFAENDPFTIQKVADCFHMGDRIGGLGELANVGLLSLDVAYSTHTGAMHLGCLAKLHDDARLRLSVDVARGDAKSKEVRFSGHLEIKGVTFDLIFKHDGSGDVLVGVLANPGGGSLKLSDLVGAVASDLPADLPLDLDFKLKSALIAYDRQAISPQGGVKQKARMLLAADLDVGIQFSGLKKIPLIGEVLPADLSFGVDFSPTVVVVPKEVTPRQLDEPAVTAITSLAGGSIPKLPPAPIAHGFHMQAALRIGNMRLAPGVLGGAGTDLKNRPMSGVPTASAAVPAQTLPSPDNISWIPVQKSLGKFVSIRRVGVGFKESRLTLLLDGSLTVKVLTLELLGLGVRYDIKTRSLDFAFLGLGFSLDKDPLKISAAFMNVDGDFVGRAQVITSKFGLSAIGAFTMLGGSPSLFLYGVLDYPLGGPVFFFVEGLAGGFGFNRHIKFPDVSEVDRFPLVQDAVSPPPQLPQSSGANMLDSIGAQVVRIHSYITPATGEYFLAAGLKFNSFRIVHCFALAIVSLDLNHSSFRVDLLGVGTWSSPPEVPSPLAMTWVRINLRASIAPMEGTVLVQAQLSPACYVQTPLCHIHGGIALAFWFLGEKAGDFVVSAGGYHPRFKVPGHYPVPARLGLDWRLSNLVAVGGYIYFALTPQYLMFGFELQAVCQIDPVRAWFDIGLDFLMQFKPLHFDGEGHIEIGAAYHTFLGDISVSAGAQLRVWGPEFAGEARAHLGPFHVTVGFGDSHNGPPPGLKWQEFKDSFLPKDHATKAISVIAPQGLLDSLEIASGPKAGTWWRVSPKGFSLQVESLLPVTAWVFAGDSPEEYKPAEPLATNLAVAPMRPSSDEVWKDSKLKVELIHAADKVEQAATKEFKFERLDKRYPASLWGAAGRNGDGRDRMVDGTTGLIIAPHTPVEAGYSSFIRRDRLDYDVSGSVQPRPVGSRLHADLPARSAGHRNRDRELIRDLLNNATVLARRKNALMDLNAVLAEPELDPAVAVRHQEDLVDAFVYAPQLSKET